MKTQNDIKYVIGIDGGGTGTRAIICNLQGEEIAFAHGPQSALGQGVEQAWKNIISTIVKALSKKNLEVPSLQQMSIGLGLSGANNIEWKNEFLIRNPGFKSIIVDTDGFTTLTGAHLGKPGSIVAVGTGSVGMALFPNGERRTVSGWGFPSGDEASGAWLGMRAASLAQKALDGRRSSTPLTESVLEYCGNTEDKFLSWLGHANQNHFAQLAPLVFQTASQDKESFDMLTKAGKEIQEMSLALDPNSELPLSVCGRLGEALIPYLPSDLTKRIVEAKFDSTHGALFLAQQNLGLANSK